MAFFRDLALITFPSGVGQGAADQHRRGYLQLAKLDQMERNAWEFFQGGSYRVNSYPKPAAFLEMLESYFGRELFLQVMRTFHERFRFGHPSGRDFLTVVNEVTGQDMTEFFEQAVWGSDLLDYGVEYVRSGPPPEPRGAFGERDEKVMLPESVEEDVPGGEDDQTALVSEVAVRRYGEVVFPVELLVSFEDGSQVTERWDGRYRWKKFRYERPARATRAEIWPGRTMWLDADLTNDSAVAEPSPAPARRLSLTFLFWLQNVLHWCGSLV